MKVQQRAQNKRIRHMRVKLNAVCTLRRAQDGNDWIARAAFCTVTQRVTAGFTWLQTPAWARSLLHDLLSSWMCDCAMVGVSSPQVILRILCWALTPHWDLLQLYYQTLTRIGMLSIAQIISPYDCMSWVMVLALPSCYRMTIGLSVKCCMILSTKPLHQ